MPTRFQATAAMAAVAALALLGAGCGSSGSGGSSSSGSSAAAPAAPVKIGVIVPENTQIYNAPDVVAAVRAAAYAENKSGGLDGHQVVVDYCNEQANPNQATACARQMVSDGVVATDYTLSVSGPAPRSTPSCSPPASPDHGRRHHALRVHQPGQLHRVPRPAV